MKDAFVQAFFKGKRRGRDGDPAAAYYGEIAYFFRHTLCKDGKNIPHHSAFIRWFNRHVENNNTEDEMVELWEGVEELNCHY